MVTIDQIDSAVKDFEKTFRHPDLPPIEQSDLYLLRPLGDQFGWPSGYPFGDRYGIYAICNDIQVLYIGKASQQPLCYRISSYFRYGEDKKSCVVAAQHVWSSEPSSVVTWAVPDESFFEASALEEYLLARFIDDLPDNRIGRRKI
ncbi:hypothetical protein GCM10008090_12970 [Arenicella chitinivorans]|uniref:GIY-YIG domain-containing protein n=1 Tax=Arenicella chitinivorans TaxID=1329800 RepID=A0A918RN96_9GAMM|nr:hypothetical protein [Arenicella chitinivorans]GHA04884.1 hypothetical protein GCM10008090_12970 [Arenicella chitinivorans]